MSESDDLVVDFHNHLVKYEDIDEVYKDYLAQLQGMPYEELVERYGAPQQVLGHLDENGVDYAVVLAETSPISAGMATNERVMEFCAASERLIPFGSVNPYMDHRPGRIVRDLAERDDGRAIRGVKLYPNYQYFYPNDRKLYPVYAEAERLGLPVMFHTGTSVLRGSRLKYSDPLYLDDVAVDFPDLTLIQCHGGRTFWFDRSFTLCRLHENVYIDLCGLPVKKIPQYFPELERLPAKFIFGTDWPGVPKTVAQNIEAVRGLGYSDETVRLILGGTAARILGLAGKPNG